MASGREVVITGVGVVSPIGLGRDLFWQSLIDRQSGVSLLDAPQSPDLPPQIAGQVRNFDAKLYVTPRKSLKVMSREIQLGFTAARLALEDADLTTASLDPDRFGVVFGADMIYCEPRELEPAFRSCQPNGKFEFDRWGTHAMGEMFPLWMLKFLPNMPACHIAIAHDARGPNNSVLMGEVSSLLALAEAMRVIERGLADVVITGGSACRTHPMSWVSRQQHLSKRRDDPARAVRPFDADRDGIVYGEGAAAFVLESRQHAESRARRPLARVASYASTFASPQANDSARRAAIRNSIAGALAAAEVQPHQLDHVNAHGCSSRRADALEAQAIQETIADVPVTAPKSFFGTLGAATGAVEMVASVLAIEHGLVPVTLNYERPDPECPLRVVHTDPRPCTRPYALLLNQATTGQAVAVLLSRPDV